MRAKHYPSAIHVPMIDFAATVGEYEDLAATIRTRGSYSLTADDEHPIRLVVVTQAADPDDLVTITLDDDTLRVVGGTDALELLAANVESMGDHPNPRPGYHAHFDAWPDHPFLTLDACPLVLGLDI